MIGNMRALMTTRFQAIEYIFIGRPDLQVLLKPYPLHLSIFAFEHELNGIKLYPQIDLNIHEIPQGGKEYPLPPRGIIAYTVLRSVTVLCRPAGDMEINLNSL